MTYSKQTWTDGPAGNTPLSAARLNNMESGIYGATTAAGTKADRVALATASLPFYFHFYETDTGYLRLWDGTAWRYAGSPGADHPFIHLGTYGSDATHYTSPSNTRINLYTMSLINSGVDLSMFTYGLGNPNTVTVVEPGRYQVSLSMLGATGAASNFYFAGGVGFTPTQSNINSKAVTYDYTNNTNSAQGGTSAPAGGYQGINLSDSYWLPAGTVITPWLTVNPAASFVLINTHLVVQRLP